MRSKEAATGMPAGKSAVAVARLRSSASGAVPPIRRRRAALLALVLPLLLAATPPRPREVVTDVRGAAPIAPRAAATENCRWPGARALEAILAVATDRGSRASGVVLAPGQVLTAAHAVADGGQPLVRLGGGYRAAELLFVDDSTDLAVLGVDTLGIEPLPIARHGPFAQQPVWAVGFPREAGRTTSSGVFQRAREGALHTSAPIDPGQSGGGLLVCDGGSYRLLGMLRGYGAYRDGDAYVKLTNHSVSVAAATIHRVLAGVR